MAKFIVARNVSMKTKAIGLEGANLGGLWAEGKEVELSKEQAAAVAEVYGKDVLVTPEAWAKSKAQTAAEG